MSRRIVPIVLFLLAAVVAGGVRYYMRSTAGPEPTKLASTGSARNVRVFLIPLAPDATGRRPAQDVWRTLFTDMAASSDTAAYLKSLYNNVPIELTAASAAEAAGVPDLGSVTLETGVRGALRVVTVQPGLDDWQQITAKIGGRSDAPHECLMGELTLVSAIRRPVDPTDLRKEPIDDLDMLIIAANHHLIFKQAGWLLVDEAQARQVFEGREKKPTP